MTYEPTSKWQGILLRDPDGSLYRDIKKALQQGRHLFVKTGGGKMMLVTVQRKGEEK